MTARQPGISVKFAVSLELISTTETTDHPEVPVFRFGRTQESRTDRLRFKAIKARNRAAEAAYKAQAVTKPKVQSAGSAIAPRVEAARTKVSEDLLPMVAGLMAAATERSRPARAEAAARSVAMWHALLGEYSAAEKARKSHKLRNTAIAVGGLSAAAAAASYAITKRSRGPEWMQDGSEEPFATAAEPVHEAASTGGTSSSSRRAATSSASSASTSQAGRGSSEHGTTRSSADKAGASPDEAAADKS
jgi:hypothetical protein